jgi:hypothetical protein
MDAAERRLKGETSPIKKTGRIAVHVPESELRKMESIGRPDPRRTKRGTAGFAIGD